MDPRGSTYDLQSVTRVHLEGVRTSERSMIDPNIVGLLLWRRVSVETGLAGFLEPFYLDSMHLNSKYHGSSLDIATVELKQPPHELPSKLRIKGAFKNGHRFPYGVHYGLSIAFPL